MNRNVLQIRNSILEFVNLTKSMPENLEIYGGMLSDNKQVLSSIATLGMKSPVMEASFREQVNEWNKNSDEFRKMVSSYKSAKAIIEKYPSIREYIVTQDDGIGSDIVNLPVIFILTTLGGSVISGSKNLFERIKLQAEMVSSLKELNEKRQAGNITEEELTLELNNLRTKLKSTPVYDFKIIVSLSLAIFSGYWFFNKTKAGKDIKQSIKQFVGGLI